MRYAPRGKMSHNVPNRPTVVVFPSISTQIGWQYPIVVCLMNGEGHDLSAVLFDNFPHSQEYSVLFIVIP